MIFEIDEIPDGGLDFKLQVDRSLLEIDQPGCALSKDVKVIGTLTKIEKDVYLNAKAQTVLTLSCSRCLSPVVYPVDCKVLSQYVPRQPSTDWEKERKLNDVDLETEDYVENKVEIKNALHDHILLTIPMVCWCNENCLGLCSKCGKDLNEGSCVCSSEQTADPRLGILKLLKDKIK